LIGLIVTLIGFGVTIVQLRRTKKVAEAIKSEAERIKLSLNTYDLAHGASRAQYALGTTRRHIRNGMWEDATETFEDFRRGLVALKANGAPLTDKQGSDIDAASKYILKLCLRIEQGAQRGNISIDVAKTLSIIRSHADLIDEISTAIHKGVLI
jgi:hypothetical protein